MMYYRVATQVCPSPPTWKWKSTMLCSLNILLQWLQMYHTQPQASLRVFSSHSREDINEQLIRENNGLESGSVTVEQFLHERLLGVRAGTNVIQERQEQGRQEQQSMASIGVATFLWKEKDTSSWDQRRLEHEQGAGGDHDTPYTFALPSSVSQIRAWIKLLANVQNGVLQP